MRTRDGDRQQRPDLSPGRLRSERHWWPLAGVVLAIAMVVGGGYVVASALSEPVGPPVGFTGVVQVRPLSGWAESGGGPLPLSVDGRPVQGLFVRITRGNGNLVLVAARSDGASPESIASAFVGELDHQLDRPTVSRNLEMITLESGVRAVRFAYVGVVADTSASVEGEVTVLVTPAGDGVVFDAFAPEGLLRFILGDVHAMEDDAGFFA